MEKRVIGNYPAIGIRPIIDARRGALRVRESLEDKTMGMALAAKKLFEENLRYSDGTPVKVVVADSSIGRVSEAAACAAKFRRECVRITLSVTPCWCYGTETMDAEPDTIKGVWGFNGTERPGAVYLAAVLAAHAQKGLPAFGIYGHEVQDVTDGSIPDDVREKLLRFGRAAVAAAQTEGTSYLQIGSACMGIAGSQITCSFFEDYLGMRVESVDEVEILRRIDKGIYDRELYEKALEWTKKNCPLGFDKNPEFIRSSPGQKEKDLEFSVKCAVIIQDLMSGNPRLPAGCEEEAGGHNAIAAGFQGQRQWTDWLPNADFAEAVCNSSFDWNGAREPFVLATENDTLNCASMLLMKLLTNRAQLFADVRTCWSAASVERVTGYRLEGKAAEAGGIIHLINSGAAALDWTLKSKENGKPAVKPWYDVTDEDIAGMLSATDWCPADNGYFRGGGFSSHFVTEDEVPCTMMRINIVRGLGPVVQIAEGWTVKLP
ncbi:MAG: L-fucose isomerase, partial [Clostridia bacterium]|nr:L-fucose isomerase [Clostridia bacterium]